MMGNAIRVMREIATCAFWFDAMCLTVMVAVVTLAGFFGGIVRIFAPKTPTND